LIEQFRARAGEEHLHRVLLGAQNRAEFGAIPNAEQRLGQMTGMLRDKFAQRSLRGIRGRGEGGVGCSGSDLFEQSTFHERGHQALEDGLHRGRDAQRSCSEFLGRAHLAQAVRELRCGQRVAGSQRGLQFLTPADRDDLIERLFRDDVQTRERQRFVRSRRGGSRGAFPIDVIDDIASAAGRAGAADAGDADRAEAIDEHAGWPASS